MSHSRPPAHGASARRASQWLGSLRATGRGASVLSISLAFAGGVVLIVQCWLIAKAINAAVLGVSAGVIWPILAVMFLRALTEGLRQGAAFDAAAAIKQRLRADLVARIADLGPAWMARHESGAVAETLSNGVEAVESYFASYLPQRIIAALIPMAILVAVFPADWVSGVILLITAPIVPLFMIIIGKGAEALSQRQWHRLARMGAHVFDAIQGLTTLRQFGAARREAAIIARISEDYRTATMSVLRVAFLSSLVLEFFATIAVAMVAVYIGFRLYYGEMAFLPGLFALLLAPEFFRPLRDMGAHYHARMDAIGAAEGLLEILHAAPPEGGTAPAPGPGDICFRDVTFRHPDGQGVQNISLTIPRGQMLAVVGASGAGKTTLASLLLGFVPPQTGRILVSGADLAQVDLADWQVRVGWMPQRATLFAGTIGENIRLARPDASDDQVAEAVRIADAAQFISQQPQGMATYLGDSGQGLSGGQIQRVAIARMLLSQADLLILDEPTAALDREAGMRVMRALRQARPDSTIIVITHDTALARTADRIIVMDHGNIVEDGTPQDLLNARGSFAAFAAIGGDHA